MPVLENTRWELFAKQVAAGKTYTNAYKSLKSKAKDPAKAGSALASNPEVRGRIDELARRAAVGRTPCRASRDKPFRGRARMGRERIPGTCADAPVHSAPERLPEQLTAQAS